MTTRRLPFIVTVMCGFAAAVLSGCSGGNGGGSAAPINPSVSLASTLVYTDKGAVQGLSTGSVRSFLGIPFAASPTGPLRFAAPQPRAAWQSTFNATQSGTPCPQNGQSTLSEDCLNLNVYAPSTGSAPLPVYVFIYGGGFAGGSNVTYDASKFAATGVIVVVPNYRVGILGWLASAALDDGNGDTGDYGLEDQQAALRWVKTNIASFGGDPTNVTLGGESAGGMSTCNNMASPGAAGLFRRAIVQSGPCAFQWQTLQQNEAAQSAVPSMLGCTGTNAQIAACLRSPTLSLSTVVSIYSSFPGGTFFPTVGGSDVPSQPRASLGKIPLLLGGNNQEAGFTIRTEPATLAAYESALAGAYGPNAAAVEAQYPFTATYPNNYAPLATAETDFNPQPRAPEIVWCNDVRTFALQGATSTPIYAYEFNDPTAPGANGTVVGPIHTAELQYLFSTGGAPLSSGSQALSAAMIQYWSNFVKTGNPNGSGLANWPAYQKPTDTLQLIPGAIATGVDVNAEHKCAFWNSLGFGL